MLLYNWWIIKEKFLVSNENDNTTYQYLWDTAKALQRRKFIAMSATFKAQKDLK
jgi:hypothetical protein